MVMGYERSGNREGGKEPLLAAVVMKTHPLQMQPWAVNL